MRKLTVGSLFAGIGGIEKGLEDTGGFETVWQVEIDDYATRVLERHWPHVRRWRDVTTFPPVDDTESNGPQDGTSAHQQATQGDVNASGNASTLRTSGWHVDLICGGFPCQDISYAGRGAGLAGERSGLFYEAARVIRTLEPRYVLLENVAALLTRGLGDVLGTLASLGYDCWWNCLQAADVGAPHIRDRVFIVAHAESMGRSAWSGEQGNEGGTGCGWSESTGSDQEMADARCELFPAWRQHNRNSTIIENGTTISRSSHWSVEPDVGRVAHGVPARVDRLRCLGNAVVPQVAQFVGEMILDMEGRT